MNFTKTDLKLKDAVEMCLHHECTEKYVVNMTFPEKKKQLIRLRQRKTTKEDKYVVTVDNSQKRS